MSELETALKLKDAVKLLKIYGFQPDLPKNSPETVQKLREAILLVAQESEWENIGICADNLTQGLEVLASYLIALGYQQNISDRHDWQNYGNKPVYIKFNTRKMNYYVDSYADNSRGVLIAMQGDEEAIVGTYGYFPLDLFTLV